MLIHSVGCCSALMGTNVHTVFTALMSVCVCVRSFFRALSHEEHTSEFASPAGPSCRGTLARGENCLLYHSSSVKGQQRVSVWVQALYTGRLHHWLMHTDALQIDMTCTHTHGHVICVCKGMCGFDKSGFETDGIVGRANTYNFNHMTVENTFKK